MKKKPQDIRFSLAFVGIFFLIFFGIIALAVFIRPILSEQKDTLIYEGKFEEAEKRQKILNLFQYRRNPGARPLGRLDYQDDKRKVGESESIEALRIYTTERCEFQVTTDFYDRLRDADNFRYLASNQHSTERDANDRIYLLEYITNPEKVEDIVATAEGIDCVDNVIHYPIDTYSFTAYY